MGRRNKSGDDKEGRKVIRIGGSLVRVRNPGVPWVAGTSPAMTRRDVKVIRIGRSPVRVRTRAFPGSPEQVPAMITRKVSLMQAQQLALCGLPKALALTGSMCSCVHALRCAALCEPGTSISTQ
jgi:hypothetical protein